MGGRGKKTQKDALSELKTLRRAMRGRFKTRVTELQAKLTSEDADQIEINCMYKVLQGKFDELVIANQNMCDLLRESGATEEELGCELDGCDEFCMDFYRVQELIEDRAERKRAVKSAASTSVAGSIAGSSKRKFKLPKIEFKPFGGDPKDWILFWGQWKKIDEDEDIEDVDKIQYLLQATSDGSRARRLVQSYPPDGKNYEKIIDAFKKRFGRAELQIELNVRNLIKLILKKFSGGSRDIEGLYDNLETHMRALETIGLPPEKYAAFLYPLVESCLPEDLLRTWQRTSEYSAIVDEDEQGSDSLRRLLEALMRFLQREVNSEQRINMTRTNSLLTDGAAQKKAVLRTPEKRATASALVDGNAKCVLCGGSHDAAKCSDARNMNLDWKRGILREDFRCLRCVRKGHYAKDCRNPTRCAECKRKHNIVVCPEASRPSETPEQPSARHQALCNTSANVFLQTLRATLYNGEKSMEVRVLVDTGAQRSYVCTSAATELGFVSQHQEEIRHALFGGMVTKPRPHECFRIGLRAGAYSCDLSALSQTTICDTVSSVTSGVWLTELREMGIALSDTKGDEPIKVLLGADVAGKLLTGRKRNLRCGLVAVETSLGWTIMGRIKGPRTDAVLLTHANLCKDLTLNKLWELDVLGIEDPMKALSEEDAAAAAREMFLNTVSFHDGRYEVRLPWLADHPTLPTNRPMAQARLNQIVTSLRRKNLLDAYDGIFCEWAKEGLIEEVVNTVNSSAIHYLPHRPVIKEASLTTKIRPVFDASAREKGVPSLNHCLVKGENLIKQIPKVLIGFRLHKVGVLADIKKAFQQISVAVTDRDALRFLWVRDERTIEYRHCRVVFGVNSSPFLLGATVEFHLEKCKCERQYARDTIDKLAKSFYVDNCVTSVRDKREAECFQREALDIMAAGGFELREWEFGDDTGVVPVLGLMWDKTRDTLGLNLNAILSRSVDKVTKRTVLSAVQSVFDPIGFTAPVLVQPKLLLRKLWVEGKSWDEPLDEESRHEFVTWWEGLPLLREAQVPRWIRGGGARHSVHVFCDASRVAYGAVIFNRVEDEDGVSVHLLAAKARVAPLKEMSIPRLELMATTVGCRLYNNLKPTLEFEHTVTYWSDSSTALAWIQRSEVWAPFVGNRVKEIRESSDYSSWKHVPGEDNPADLPSRGCTAKKLIEQQWWNGPAWLRLSKQEWPATAVESNEEEVLAERKKGLLIASVDTQFCDLRLDYFSSHLKTVRMVAWILRFYHNAANPKQRQQGELTVPEVQLAERHVWTIVQRQSFTGTTDDQIINLTPFVGQDGIIRMRSRVCLRDDTDDFRFPVVLPGNHAIVRRMIHTEHVRLCHVGAIGLLSALREHFWIVNGRKAVRSIVRDCVKCRRYSVRAMKTVSCELPKDRIRDARVFEVTGVDFAGPLLTKGGGKTWICIFTCAVYRAVHLEVVTSMSSEAFLLALRRFAARRGRPSKIYSDNGRNFVGTANLFDAINWEKVQTYSTNHKIEWIFNPPTAAWWGGWWERLIGILKRLLRRILGRASLDYEELVTVICDCEAVMNNRPLTPLTEAPDDLVALTPNSFLMDGHLEGMPDADMVDGGRLSKRAAYRQSIRDVLRKRFRCEYLGQLKTVAQRHVAQELKVGDIVLLGSDNEKRIDWPLARVEELVPGKGGVSRVVRVRTAQGFLTRPVQRIFPLECATDCETPRIQRTQRGRMVKAPERFTS